MHSYVGSCRNVGRGTPTALINSLELISPGHRVNAEVNALPTIINVHATTILYKTLL